VVTSSDGLTLSVRSDEAYLYFLLQTGGRSLADGPYYIAADTIAGQGNTSYDERALERAADFLIRIDGEENSVMLTDPYYDVFQYQYAVQNTLIEAIDHQFDKDSGTFVPIYAAMNRELVLPESGQVIPFSKFNAGDLHYGISDPDNLAFDSLSDFYAGKESWRSVSRGCCSMCAIRGRKTSLRTGTSPARLRAKPLNPSRLAYSRRAAGKRCRSAATAGTNGICRLTMNA
jgi:hypothetical protein